MTALGPHVSCRSLRRPLAASGQRSQQQHLDLDEKADDFRPVKGSKGRLKWLVTPEIISYLSEYFVFSPGDLIYAGTPAGVGAIRRGQTTEAHVEGVDEL